MGENVGYTCSLTSYISRKGSTQKAALTDIKLAHDAAEYMGTLYAIREWKGVQDRTHHAYINKMRITYLCNKGLR
jgi:hypothetical protein